MTEAPKQREFVREVTRQLYFNNIGTIVAGSLLAILLALILHDAYQGPLLYVWLFLLLTTYLGRHLLTRVYFRNEARDHHAWLNRFRTGIALQGTLWGVAVPLFYPHDHLMVQVAFLFTFSGLAAGGAIAFGLDLLSVYLFELPLSLALLAHFLAHGNFESVLMSLMVMVFLGYLAISLTRSSRTMRENISLRLDAALREELMRNQHALLNTILESEPECVKLIAPDGQVQQMNQAGLTMLEAEDLEALNRAGLFNLVHPDERAAFQALLSKVAAGESGQLKFRITGLRGTARWLESNAAPLRNTHGEITAVLSVTRDISERVAAEAQLRESGHLLNSIVEHIPNMIFLKDAKELRFRMLNSAGEKLLGRDRATMLGKNDHELFPKEQADFQAGNDRRVLEDTSDEVLNISEETIMTPRGMRILRTQKLPLRDEQNRAQYLLGISEDITERRQHERALHESEEKLRGLYELAPLGIALSDMDGRHVEFNEAFRTICGYSETELKALDYRVLTPLKYEADEARQLESLMKTGRYGPYEKEYIRKDGTLIPLRLNGMLVSGRDGKQYIWSIVEDISGSRQAEREVRIAATAFESQEGMIITDEQGSILRVNKAFSEITGYSSEEVTGKNPRLLNSGRHDQRFFDSMWQSITTGGSWAGEVWNRRKSGELFPEYLSISSVKDEDGKVINYVGSFTDITQRKKSEEEIQRLAFYDHLTLLPNRRLFMDRLRQTLAAAARKRHNGALLFIDIDNFKNLNDTLGHDYGDLLLQQIATRLKLCVREGDTVARLGGDEFVVLLEDLADQMTQAIPQVEMIGKKILELLGQPYDLQGTHYSSTPSIGITLLGEQQIGAEDFLKQADIAMYQAKKSGRNMLRFFDEHMQEAISRRTTLESDLRGALKGEQFQLYYQVQKTGQGRAVGAEVLLRWMHPERGMVSPAEFIPLAEETGDVISIGQYVLDRVCAQLKKWEQHPLARNFALAVNVSARQFHQPGFAGMVESIVREHNVNPGRLKLELTESAVLQDIEDTVKTMNALNRLGVQISLDDFGTGYSSLQYLRRLPLDQLKIDQSFVRDIAEDGGDLAIVQTIIAMADSLGLDIIAEGVETERQRQLLQKSGCTHFQGYLFGKPMPIAAFEAALES